MFHLAANFVAIANVANTEVPALNDDVLPRTNSNRHTMQEDMSIVMAHSTAVTLLRTRLNIPRFRDIAAPFLLPVGITLLPPTDPNFQDYRMAPLRLRRDEAIIYESTDSAAGPNNHYILTWLSPGPLEPMPPGDIYTLRGTSTTAAVASTWTTITVTWDNELPPGIYAVVGGMCHATNQVAFSLIFTGQTWRPGGLGGASAGIRPPWPQLNGGLGVWGRFRSVNPPQVRVLNDGTDNAHTVYLQVVRVSGSNPI